jgi:hypothetical protein
MDDKHAGLIARAISLGLGAALGSKQLPDKAEANLIGFVLKDLDGFWGQVYEDGFTAGYEARGLVIDGKFPPKAEAVEGESGSPR